MRTIALSFCSERVVGHLPGTRKTKSDRVVSSEASIAGAPHPPSGLPEWLQTQAQTHGAAYSYNRATVAIGISRTLLPDSRFLRR